MIPAGYMIDHSTGALCSIDKSISAKYDHDYVARYENYPQAELSAIRAVIASRFCDKMETVCDVGFGTGAFLSEIHDLIPSAGIYGFDVSPYAPPPFVQIEPNWIDKEWSLLTFFDSLEHFQSISFIRSLQTKVVMVSVPWFHPYFGEKWFNEWKHKRPGEHLWHFTPSRLAAAFANGGYKTRYIGSPEDYVRVGTGDCPNILTMVFSK